MMQLVLLSPRGMMPRHLLLDELYPPFGFAAGVHGACQLDLQTSESEGWFNLSATSLTND